jgi:hypothetical protein
MAKNVTTNLKVNSIHFQYTLLLGNFLSKRTPYAVVYLEISITKSISLVGLIFELALFGTGTLIFVFW